MCSFSPPPTSSYLPWGGLLGLSYRCWLRQRARRVGGRGQRHVTFSFFEHLCSKCFLLGGFLGGTAPEGDATNAVVPFTKQELLQELIEKTERENELKAVAVQQRKEEAVWQDRYSNKGRLHDSVY